MGWGRGESARGKTFEADGCTGPSCGELCILHRASNAYIMVVELFVGMFASGRESKP